jgi:hypothetical protein
LYAPPIKKIRGGECCCCDVLYPSAVAPAGCMHACNAGCTSSDGIPDRRPGEAKAACALRRGVVQCRPPARRAQLPGSSFFFPASKGCLLQRHSFGPALTAAYALFPVPDSYYSALCMLHCLPVAEYATHVVLPTTPTYVLWPYGNARVRPSLVLQKPKQKILKLNKEKILAF